MSLTQKAAEKLGWEFYGASPERQDGGRAGQIEVPMFGAQKRWNETVIAKEHPTQEQLLVDIEQWEKLNEPGEYVDPDAPEPAPIVLPDKTAFPEAHARAVVLAEQGIDWVKEHAEHVWGVTAQEQAPAESEPVALTAPAAEAATPEATNG